MIISRMMELVSGRISPMKTCFCDVRHLSQISWGQGHADTLELSQLLFNTTVFANALICHICRGGFMGTKVHTLEVVTMNI